MSFVSDSTSFRFPPRSSRCVPSTRTPAPRAAAPNRIQSHPIDAIQSFDAILEAERKLPHIKRHIKPCGSPSPGPLFNTVVVIRRRSVRFVEDSRRNKNNHFFNFPGINLSRRCLFDRIIGIRSNSTITKSVRTVQYHPVLPYQVVSEPLSIELN